MLYGLHFECDANITAQFSLDTANGNIYCRYSSGGSWSAWRRLDVTRNQDGTLIAKVQECERARQADVASRLRYPVKMTFGGDVQGSVSFDGSGEAHCNLTLTSTAGGPSDKIKDIEKRLASIEQLMEYYHNTTGGSS